MLYAALSREIATGAAMNKDKVDMTSAIDKEEPNF